LSSKKIKASLFLPRTVFFLPIMAPTVIINGYNMEMPLVKNASRLGDVIEAIVGSLGQGKNFHGWRIVSRWPEIVGPQMARSSRAVRYADGVLYVVVKGDAWRQELEMDLEHILGMIHAVPGGRAVERIVLRAGSHLEHEDERNDG
jgi:predicted nucleic acid-binding Zn ribbon protein